MVVHFDADQGEMDTFLGMDCIYTDRYDGTRRIDYGAKYNSVAVIKITVIKTNGQDFTVAEVRDFLKWTTGVRKNSYLDLLVEDRIQCSFLGRVTNAFQQKLDARTVGLAIEFTSVSPWAYSPIQYAGYSTEQGIGINSSGVVYKSGTTSQFKINNNGILYDNSLFKTTDDGVLYLDNSSTIQIDNETDDLYTPIYLNTVFTNGTCATLSIKNVTLGEESIITSIQKNEIITLSAEQFITSDAPNKIFGNTFNFIWPRLAPGINEFTITMDGSGSVEFTYRYPIKIGDCTIDTYVSSKNLCCGDSSNNTLAAPVSWSDVINTPTTIEGYGITNAYNMVQVDNKIENIDATVNEQALNNMLESVLDE